ncbi:MAG: DUF4304 domain-containing protein [Lachnospiraceae bacterium]|nr:DUF4304 domain-containing protein [Lachnospiraceae bacterium]
MIFGDKHRTMIGDIFSKAEKNINVTETINLIENQVYKELKDFGFRKHGRTLHRFVSDDISHVVFFQCGQAYREETHLMWVRLGIRIPECVERVFNPVNDKKYYHEYDCNMRSDLGAVKTRNKNKNKTFNLRKDDPENISREILAILKKDVLPIFDNFSSRQAVIDHRRDYPYFDTLNSRLILLEEAMIYGHMGELDMARETFDTYYKQSCKEKICPQHIEYLDKLRIDLGL